MSKIWKEIEVNAKFVFLEVQHPYKTYFQVSFYAELFRRAVNLNKIKTVSISVFANKASMKKL